MVHHVSNGDVTEADTAIVYILSWLAVKSDDTAAIAHTLGMIDLRSCSVEEGFYESGPRLAHRRPLTRLARFLGLRPPAAKPEAPKYFIAPPIDGWTLVFGADIAFGDELRTELSRVFGEAQAFHSYQDNSGYRWARSRGGKTVRAVTVDDGDVTSEGETSPPEPEPANLSRANEYDVLRIARGWSVDPNVLVRNGTPGQLGTRGMVDYQDGAGNA